MRPVPFPIRTEGRSGEDRAQRPVARGEQHDFIIWANSYILNQLPDFLEALKSHETQAVSPSSRAQSPRSPAPTSPSRSSLPAGKLRYDAYELPPPTSSLRVRRASSSQRSITSSRSDHDHDLSRASSRLSGSVDLMSQTITAGALALATGTQELERLASVSIYSFYVNAMNAHPRCFPKPEPPPPSRLVTGTQDMVHVNVGDSVSRVLTESLSCRHPEWT